MKALLLLLAVAGLFAVGWVIGRTVGEAVRPPGQRWFDLYDVFDEEDQDAIC